ncbi:MAG: inner membrane CreD family protein, partial [Saprospiraceae bacterium]
MKTNFLNSRSKVMTLKMIAIFFLILLLLVPKFMVEDLVSERNRLNESVSHEVSSHWSGDQLISGPYLVIPYWNQVYNESNKTYDKIESQVIVFPESLDIAGILSTTSKYRSLYNVLLYESNIKINGEFKMPDFKEINILKESLIWDKAMLRFPFSDSKGINSEIKFNVDSTPLILNPGMGNFKCSATNNNQDDEYTHSLSRIFPNQNSFNTGLSCKFPIVEGTTNYHFNLEMSLKGSSSLLFSPIAKTTQVKLSSTFKDPSFVGEFLPEHNLSNSGFEANWK